jgi:hypothetical protein
MPPFFLADNFLAGSLLTLVLPIGLLIAVAVWYVRTVRHIPEDTPTASATLPSSDVLAAADPEAEDILAIPPADNA